MSTLAGLQGRLRAVRRRTLEALYHLSEGQLEKPVPWQGRDIEVRFYLLRLAERDDYRRAYLISFYTSHGWQPSLALLALQSSREVHGQLRAVLAGVPDGLLDREPAPGEWTIRQVLSHVEHTDWRYLQQTAYAVERVHNGGDLPVRVSEERLRLAKAEPPSGEPLAEILERMGTLRDEVVSRLHRIENGDLVAPTIWSGWEVDVHFRLYRFVTHERQHTVQITKALHLLGFIQNEAQIILGQAEIARGKLEAALAGLPEDLIARPTTGQQIGAMGLLRESADEEEQIVERIQTALR